MANANRINEIKEELVKNSSKSRSEILQKFFKTHKGGYGEGDIFIGVSMPALHSIAKQFHEITLSDLEYFLQSAIHEERMFSLICMINQYKKAYKNNYTHADCLIDLYIKNVSYINNWDLIDVSCHKILGHYIYSPLSAEKKQELLDLFSDYVKSDQLWLKRIAIISTYYLIKNDQFDLTINYVTQVMQDKHDLIHKAAGWMLREIGKKNLNILISFLEKYSSNMPRTMLRYAIEKLSDRHYWLKKDHV